MGLGAASVAFLRLIKFLRQKLSVQHPLYTHLLNNEGSFKIFLSALLATLGQWLTGSVTATLKFKHKEWLLRLEILQTFDQSDIQTKRQKNKASKMGV